MITSGIFRHIVLLSTFRISSKLTAAFPIVSLIPFWPMTKLCCIKSDFRSQSWTLCTRFNREMKLYLNFISWGNDTEFDHSSSGFALETVDDSSIIWECQPPGFSGLVVDCCLFLPENIQPPSYFPTWFFESFWPTQYSFRDSSSAKSPVC